MGSFLLGAIWLAYLAYLASKKWSDLESHLMYLWAALIASSIVGVLTAAFR
jgi:hypothetical protein